MTKAEWDDVALLVRVRTETGSLWCVTTSVPVPRSFSVKGRESVLSRAVRQAERDGTLEHLAGAPVTEVVDWEEKRVIKAFCSACGRLFQYMTRFNTDADEWTDEFVGWIPCECGQETPEVTHADVHQLSSGSCTLPVWSDEGTKAVRFKQCLKCQRWVPENEWTGGCDNDDVLELELETGDEWMRRFAARETK